MIEKIKAFIDREKRSLELKELNDKLADRNRILTEGLSGLQEDMKKMKEEVDRLNLENKCLSSNHIFEWKEYMMAIEGSAAGFSLSEIEAQKVIESQNYPAGLIKTFHALGKPEGLRQHLINFCYMVSMKGRIAGKSEDYNTALIDLVDLISSISLLETKGKGTKPNK